MRDVTTYLGYDKSLGYQLVDMTEDARDQQQDFGAPLGRHPVSPLWKNADFRISFAKNQDPPLRLLHSKSEEYLRRLAPGQQV